MAHKRRPPEGFGERLKESYLKSGYSLYDVERLIGVNHSNFLAYIHGDMAPTIINFARICKLFNVSADYLLFGKEVEKCST